MYIVVLMTGILLGMILYSMLSANRINEMQSLIDTSRKSLANAENRVFERNKLIRIQSKEIEELKSKIVDLENNIELLANNSKCKKIKKLLIATKLTNNF